MSVPALRFQGEHGHDYPAWISKSIGDVLTIGSGRDYKHLALGNIPVYGTGGYMLAVDDYLYDGESVCIGRKGTIDKPTLLNGKFWTVDTLFYTHSFKDCLPKFVYACFQRIDWKSHNEASGVPSLSKSTIEKIDIHVPTVEEQTKIANFLTAVDEKITQLTQKCELLAQYKKGVMQQIFSQELRFKDDDGQDFPEWGESLIGDIFNDLKGSGLSKDKVSSSGKYKSILYGHLFTKYTEVIKKIDSWTDFNEGLPSKAGDILMPSSTTTTGIDLAKASALKEDSVRLGGDIIVLRTKNAVNSDYFAYYLTHAANREIAEVTQGITIIHLYFKELKKIEINVPSIKEQTKIANFLTAIDDKLTHTQAQLTAAKQYKQGLLQQMFL